MAPSILEYTDIIRVITAKGTAKGTENAENSVHTILLSLDNLSCLLTLSSQYHSLESTYMVSITYINSLIKNG